MSILHYSLSYLFTLTAILTLKIGGWSLLCIPTITFVVIPAIEIVYRGSESNLAPEDAASRARNFGFDLLLYGMLPMQIALILLMSVQIDSGALNGIEILGAIATVGICCGAFGINIAHELGHRNKPIAQFFAKGLLLTSLYMHFFIEHNRGHHQKVATPEDPASSRYGQSLYPFWWRSVSRGYLSAWSLEHRRLERKGLPAFHWRNEMLNFQVIQYAAVALLFYYFGIIAALAFVGAACLGILLLETINYVEHYGLERSQKDNGRYERVRPHHSWNSNHSIGRALLFELTRHSDHHAYASRKYTALRHFDNSPQLPYGYPGMILIALVPSLWFSIMNPHVERELSRLQSLAE